MAGRELIAEIWDYLHNARIVRTAAEYSTLLIDFIRSADRLESETTSFEDVHTYVIFTGVGRSGTTLVGALLDAHPEVAIARQQNTLKYLYPLGFSRERIFRLLLRNSADQARHGWPGGGGYHYAVPGQFQGIATNIQVIGDKSKSAQSIEWLSSRPDLLERLHRTVRCRIGLLHVIRNPFDTIARRSLVRQVSLGKICHEYFSLTDRLQDLLHRFNSDQYSYVMRVPVHLEDLVNNPAQELTNVCSRLGIQASQPYLEACSGIVHSRPGRTRELVSWPPHLLEEVQQKIRVIPWLKHYTYE